MKQTKRVMVGAVPVGGGAAVSVQSMCTTDTRDIEATAAQISELESLGCDIIRVAVPDGRAASAISKIIGRIRIPLVADIHFDYRLAIASAENGASKLRINPGNIGGEDRVKALTDCARAHRIPIRIGVNLGSLEPELEKKYGATPQAMVRSALGHVRLLEKFGFDDIVLSLKASDVSATVEAYRLIAQSCGYPLHIGVTEAGTVKTGTIKSAIGIGSLLLDGIGDTLRVSLTGEPAEEVRVGKSILKALGLRSGGVTVISCPTCGRCHVDIIGIAQEVEERTAHMKEPITIAVMGCAVNGPGEARHADIGIAGGGEGSAVIFRRGEKLRTVRGNILEELMLEVDRLIQEKDN
ncbi:MAG: flavodoxin-dependent (E)-4-hydroxy-3-methylbut-2-enyl-diphosphate synthase [Christensenellales bacterium]|jgi:(E)-4-hydroxy-3-methylbut-2-enyl-diphosphate synthase